MKRTLSQQSYLISIFCFKNHLLKTEAKQIIKKNYIENE